MCDKALNILADNFKYFEKKLNVSNKIRLHFIC